MQTAIQQAIKAGFTHVSTAGGAIPLAEWQYNADPLTFEKDALYQEWRQAFWTDEPSMFRGRFTLSTQEK